MTCFKALGARRSESQTADIELQWSQPSVRYMYLTRSGSVGVNLAVSIHVAGKS